MKALVGPAEAAASGTRDGGRARREGGRWEPYLRRYRGGEWRDRVFRDMILEDARRMAGPVTFVDIGCGHGFDGDVPLQRSLAAEAGRYVGIEPDRKIELGPYFTETHRCLFEDAPLASGSVHVAFAVMVLEHLPAPERFWAKVRQVLVPGGVFWALTIDARHWFCRASKVMERLRIKDLYLNRLLGARGSERYENYPVYYRTNTPAAVRGFARGFASCDTVNFSREGQCGDYFPRPLRGLANWWDRRGLRRGRPGTLLVVRAVR